MTSPTLESRGNRAFVLACIILLALNLRASVGSVGVVLNDIRGDLDMSATAAGALTTLPVICFALVGSLANTIVRAIGLHTTAIASTAVVAVGLAARTFAESGGLFLIASAVALAGCAIGNVILPPLVKVHFPDRIALVSSIAGAAIVGGATLSAALTVPIAEATGDWRWGLFTWALLAAVTLVPWLRLLRHDVRSTDAATPITIGELVRAPLAWMMAVCFGAQAAQAYAQFGWFPAILEDAGLSDAYAGSMLAIVTGIGIPAALLLPAVIGWSRDRAWLPWSFAVVTAAGWLGVLWWPTAAPWAWAVLLGIGGAAFPWVLTMIAKRSRTHEGTVALSGFVQGLGYLIAALGPFGTGLLHDSTGGWGAPVAMLVALALLIGVVGTYVARPVMVEDQLHAR
ncbi:MFS transporter [Mumia sp. zg.B17]|uniref:MFS transporter n=1 Tax=unclassified Mumia TaxID=2621872 RepID=UPI001C6DDC1A|nr:MULTISPECIES: MFS transporter [unclassified Mumia]MBW9206526.1 MFS transporter [Mumia sp. zg.B17]MBW9211184.1 MFS transporter [Mumia sp. zg.B21]MDD9349433.1 MFS transporter [Mumia sp.]